MTGIILLWLAPSLMEAIAQSGRATTVGDSPSQRVLPRAQVAPGPAPSVTFRLFEGRLRHRFNNLDLVLDDAGH